MSRSIFRLCCSVRFSRLMPLFNLLDSEPLFRFVFFFFNDTATPEIYPLPLHAPLPIYDRRALGLSHDDPDVGAGEPTGRSEEHTSELQSLRHLVCRLLLEKKKKPNSRRQQEANLNTGREKMEKRELAI